MEINEFIEKQKEIKGCIGVFNFHIFEQIKNALKKDIVEAQRYKIKMKDKKILLNLKGGKFFIIE